MKTELKFEVGHRYLISFYDYPSRNNLNEVRVLELSEGGRVKLEVKCSDDTEYYKWYEIYGMNIVEDLGLAKCPIDPAELLDKEYGVEAKEPKKKIEVDGNTSDGYHTFDELYRYRMLYNAAFFNELNNRLTNRLEFSVCKSYRHSDGELCFGGGWFIVTVQLPTGQISNHYKNEYWDLFKIPEVDEAPEWDGHTPNEAADRLEKYIGEYQ